MLLRNLKIIATIGPLIYGTLIFFGFINKSIFYKEFGIKIFNFISLSEILLSFIPIVFLIALILIGSILLNLYSRIVERLQGGLHRKLNKSVRKLSKGRIHVKYGQRRSLSTYSSYLTNHRKLRLISRKTEFKIILNIIFHPKIIALTAILFLLNLVLNQALEHPTGSRIDQVLVAIMFTFIISSEVIYIVINQVVKVVISYNTFLGYSVIFWILLTLSITNNLKSEQIKTIGSTKEVEFMYMKNKIITDENREYIGETLNYLFLYRTDSTTTEIYPKKDLSNYRVTQWSNYVSDDWN